MAGQRQPIELVLHNKGDKITYGGKKYECVKNNVMWSPDVNPKCWKEVVEDDI